MIITNTIVIPAQAGIQCGSRDALDCFATLAMTKGAAVSRNPQFVTPAQAGVSGLCALTLKILAFAGMTREMGE